MISKIEFADVKQSSMFSYATALKYFETHKAVAFKPGLNILYGPNGCGKSTILRMAALTLAAEQGGVSTITSSWLQEISDFGGKSTMKGIEVSHDGQPILYGNPRNAVGLFGGGAAFDDDFMMEGLANIQSKASTGLTTMNRLNRMLAVALGKAPFPEKIDDRMKSQSPRYAEALKLLKASIPKGQRTLIFDEPESGLAIPAQYNLFNILFKAAKEFDLQIILATHSAFSLGLPDCNYIEMEPTYIEHSQNALSNVHLRFEIMKLTNTAKLSRKEPIKKAEAVKKPVTRSTNADVKPKPATKRKVSVKKAK